MEKESPAPGLSAVQPVAPERLCCVVLCWQCNERRRLEVARGHLVVLEPDGRLRLPCPACGTFGPHSLIRFGA